MELKITSKNAFSLLEIHKNGSLASAQNPIQVQEYQDFQFPEINGQLLVISGMPQSATNFVSLHYKNLFNAIAIANPRDGVAEIVHSVSPIYKVGTTIPLQ